MNTNFTRAERRRIKNKARKAKRIAEKAKSKLTSSLLYGIALIVMVGLGILFVREISKPLPGIQVPIVKGEHTTDESSFKGYNSPVPTSGNHYSNWNRKWGFQPKPISPGAYIHNMEHGGIVVLYQPDIDQETLNEIKNFAEKTHKVLATESSLIPKTIAIASWGWYQLFDEFDKDGLKAFYKAHLNKSPENVYP